MVHRNLQQRSSPSRARDQLFIDGWAAGLSKKRRVLFGPWSGLHGPASLSALIATTPGPFSSGDVVAGGVPAAGF